MQHSVQLSLLIPTHNSSFPGIICTYLRNNISSIACGVTGCIANGHWINFSCDGLKGCGVGNHPFSALYWALSLQQISMEPKASATCACRATLTWRFKRIWFITYLYYFIAEYSKTGGAMNQGILESWNNTRYYGSLLFSLL